MARHAHRSQNPEPLKYGYAAELARLHDFCGSGHTSLPPEVFGLCRFLIEHRFGQGIGFHHRGFGAQDFIIEGSAGPPKRNGSGHRGATSFYYAQEGFAYQVERRSLNSLNRTQVRFGSKADLALTSSACPLSAISGHSLFAFERSQSQARIGSMNGRPGGLSPNEKIEAA
jgi:hypothetical protein